MIKNASGQSIGAQMVDATTGAAFVGTVTVYVTIDAGTQAIGSVGSGVCTAEGNGYYTYRPATAETNGDLLAFTFIGSGSIPATIQVATVTQAQLSAINAATSTTRTVRDQITAALFDLALLQAGEVPSADDLAFAFLRFNDWIDGLKTHGLTAYTVTRTTWTLTTATSYTVGLAGTIAIDRPINPTTILNTGYVNTNLTDNPEYPLGDVLTEDQYAGLTYKAYSSPYPQRFYYNPTFPFGTLRPWPIPSSSGLQGVIYAAAPVSEFATVDDGFILPPGYRRCFRTNLAVELAAAFDTQPSPSLLKAATESLQDVKRANVRMVDLTSNAQGVFSARPAYNILTDSR